MLDAKLCFLWLHIAAMVIMVMAVVIGMCGTCGLDTEQHSVTLNMVY